MNFIVSLLAGIAFPAPPTLAGWLVWALLLAWLTWYLRRNHAPRPPWTSKGWGLFFFLFLLVPVFNLFIGIRLGAARPLPGLPAEAPGSALMVFSAVAWMLGGGFLGPLAAALLGAFSGLLRGVWDFYSLFPIAEFALLAVWFSSNVRQRYRTSSYRLLRQPLAAALLLIPAHVLFYTISALFTQWGADIPVAARLDLALSNALVVSLAFGGEMLVGGLIAQIASVVFSAHWGENKPLQPSPGEKSLEARFIFAVGAFIAALLISLLVGGWAVAGRAARGMLEDRLVGAGESAAQSVPFFLETGQNLATQFAADPDMRDANGAALTRLIQEHIKSVPYFDQIVVLDANTKEVLALYPEDTRQGFRLYPDEDSGVLLAAQGVLTQIYSIPANARNSSARVSFLAAIEDQPATRRVLIGRTTIEANPLTLPLIKNLDSMNGLGGSGLLIDDSNRILYDSSRERGATFYEGRMGAAPFFYDDISTDGTRQMVYYQPVVGRPWAVALTVPAQRAQQLAVNIAAPLALMILVLAAFALIFLRLALRVVTNSLKSLSDEANRIAQGNLDHPLQVTGEDEVAQLRRAFEKMRVGLNARLEESERLLQVSQAVASTLETKDAVKPALEAIAEATGASSVRVVLSPSILPDTLAELPTRFASGPAPEKYAYLDDQILDLAQSREKIVISNLARSRELTFEEKQPQPLALLAVALRHENRYYGVVWAGYEQQRRFTEEDERFVTTLAGQAALAVVNAHLYLNVEASRRQLESILNSSPDPVIVTDQRNRLLLTNHAANAALRQGAEHARSGVETEKVIKLRPLLELLHSAATEMQSSEIILPDQRTYLATTSPVMVEGRQIGRVCVMRDITHFKELDTMKSEFVATVSHDLRSPLTLMRGYATMLDTVGELNEQQQTYVKKIVTGVENMSRLVNNLLDLGRIEFGVGLQVESVPVLSIIERVTGALQLQASQKNIVLQVELPKDMPHAVEADQALLHQAVYNLVENALKYTPPNEKVTVRTISHPHDLIFAVEDSGIGIAAEDIPHLFEKFYRGKQREARINQPGSGLGLAIVQSIAENHHGRVWVESELGKGSIFYLQIPLKQKPSDDSQESLIL
ncbi:MAG: HAMP domain-containing protein [Anaerolineales bacterium]|nr:HAMP domain-containing protein [Anaerolineales bacterium]